jgi:hypothetical protein
MSTSPAVKAKWRKKHRRTWSADLPPEEFEKLKQIQGDLSNYRFLKKIIINNEKTGS